MNANRLSNHWTTYRIQHRDGAFVPMNADGDYLDCKELETLIQGLQFTLRQMESGNDPEQIIEVAAMSCLNEILHDHSVWMPIGLLPDYEYCDDNQRRRVESGNCVYFLEHPSFPDRVKIGQAINLYKRMKYYWVHWGFAVRPQLKAVIQTPHHKQLERLIHRNLADWRITGEWFEKGRVYDWLEGVQS